MTKKLIAFGWFGGKYSHLSQLLPLVPRHICYCEPFGGSAALLLNKELSKVEIYNDLDGNLVNFFKVLREAPEEFQRLVELTPYSREEYLKSLEVDPSESDIERARLFYVRARQVRGGMAQAATPGKWSTSKTDHKRGIATPVSRWLGGIEKLADIAKRFKHVLMEHKPAIEIIKYYDSPDTFFYIDPPYVHESRIAKSMYKHEMSENDHAELAKVLNECTGKALISGYESDLYDKLYSNWKKIEISERQSWSSPNRDKRTEIVWTNGY